MQKMLAHLRVRTLLPVVVLAFISAACGPPPADPRTLVPADALIYLESKDVGKAIRSITDSSKYHELAATVPDLSALDGVEMAVAITGFETAEEAAGDDSVVVGLRPRFVAVAETHFWNFQVNSVAENELGGLVNEMYGSDAVLETSEKHGGRYYTWTAKDGKRKAYALVIGSLLIFGNDETAIDKCIAVKNGEAESILATGKITDGERLAFGYIAPDGVLQIANIAGISMAMNSSEDVAAQSFIARVLPEIMRNSVKEITWTATSAENGVEDRYIISADPESAAVLNETIVFGGGKTGVPVARFFGKARTVSRYALKDPRVAWRSVLLTARSKVDDTSGEILAAFSGSLFTPYGVADPELFLGSVVSPIYTATFDDEGETLLVAARFTDAEQLKRSLVEEFDTSKPAEKLGTADSWLSEDGELRVIFTNEWIIIGAGKQAAELYRRMALGEPPSNTKDLQMTDAAIVTFGEGIGNVPQMIGVLSEMKAEGDEASLKWRTETRFDRNGMIRTTTSDFGLVGTIIAQFATEETLTE